jgi:alpha-amylase
VFGGKLAWGPDAIVRDDPNFHGRGNISSGKFHTVFVVVYYIDFAMTHIICEVWAMVAS